MGCANSRDHPKNWADVRNWIKEVLGISLQNRTPEVIVAKMLESEQVWTLVAEYVEKSLKMVLERERQRRENMDRRREERRRHSRTQPEADLVKLKKKYETDAIKSAKLLNIWVIGGNKTKTLQLAEMISHQQNYMLITEDLLLQKEMTSDTERSTIVREILEDKGVICPGIVLDLVVETILEKLDEIKGVVFHGIPTNREQALHLQRLVGLASLVIYCELKGESLRTALTDEGEEPSTIRSKVDHFQKSVLQLSKHKTTMTVDGEKDPVELIEVCLEKIQEMANEV